MPTKTLSQPLRHLKFEETFLANVIAAALEANLAIFNSSLACGTEGERYGPFGTAPQ